MIVRLKIIVALSFFSKKPFPPLALSIDDPLTPRLYLQLPIPHFALTHLTPFFLNPLPLLPSFLPLSFISHRYLLTSSLTPLVHK